MVAAAKGAVVNSASIGSKRGLAGACAYNAAKRGAVGLTCTAASAVAQKGVRALRDAKRHWDSPAAG